MWKELDLMRIMIQFCKVTSYTIRFIQYSLYDTAQKHTKRQEVPNLKDGRLRERKKRDMKNGNKFGEQDRDAKITSTPHP